MAVRDTAEQAQLAGKLGGVGDLGLLDWSAKLLSRCDRAIHDELCDQKKGELKEEYKRLLATAGSTDNVKQIATIITSALSIINPALGVSSVIVYFSLWLTKVGLNYWCAQAPVVSP